MGPGDGRGGGIRARDLLLTETHEAFLTGRVTSGSGHRAPTRGLVNVRRPHVTGGNSGARATRARALRGCLGGPTLARIMLNRRSES